MKASTIPLSERSARNTLLFGGLILALGLGLVGVGADGVGAVPVLAGLLVTVFAIHNYGRLGPVEEAEPAGSPVAGQVAAATDRIWQGGLLFVAGLAMTISATLDARASGSASVLAYGAILGGGAWALSGRFALRDAKRIKAKVEKRRRMDKSPPP
jgi:hypothetical protein